MMMNLIECEDKLYAKGKCIGTVKEVLDRLLNARKEYDQYLSSNISASHSNSYIQDTPSDFVDRLFADLPDRNQDS